MQSVRAMPCNFTQACSFFVDAALSDIRVRGVEKVISAKSHRKEEPRVCRQPNENLRGSEHWENTWH